MITRLIILFKIGRKLAQSEVLDIFSKFHEVPTFIKILFYFLSFSFKKKTKLIIILKRKKDYQVHYNQWEQLL